MISQNDNPSYLDRIRWCDICKGLHKPKCLFCGQLAVHIRRKFPKEVEQYEYLWITRLKLIKFNMKSTGSPEVDKQIIDAFGPWRLEQHEEKELNAFLLLHYLRNNRK